MKISIIHKKPYKILGIAFISFLTPSLFEELCFRVLMLPHPYEEQTLRHQTIWSLISLVTFVIYHPIQGLFWNSAGYKIFTQPIFLMLATFLGAICTVFNLVTGSVWICSLVHWLMVIIWLTALGGMLSFYNFIRFLTNPSRYQVYILNFIFKLCNVLATG